MLLRGEIRHVEAHGLELGGFCIYRDENEPVFSRTKSNQYSSHYHPHHVHMTNSSRPMSKVICRVCKHIPASPIAYVRL